MWPDAERYSFYREKFQVLRDFGIKLTMEQKETMYSLPSEVRVDNYIREIIVSNLDALPHSDIEEVYL